MRKRSAGGSILVPILAIGFRCVSLRLGPLCPEVLPLLHGRRGPVRMALEVLSCSRHAVRDGLCRASGEASWVRVIAFRFGGHGSHAHAGLLQLVVVLDKQQKGPAVR